MATPLRTYDGLTKTGYPTDSAKRLAFDMLVNFFHAGWLIFKESNNFPNFSLSSARSTLSLLVPTILIPCLASLGATLFAVCPPTQVTTPAGFSFSKMSIILSKVNSSKYNLSEMS